MPEHRGGRRARTNRSAAMLAPVATEEARILHALDHSPLTRRHYLFLAALLGALVFDYMKPATLGYVIPGMREMFALSQTEASWLAVSGITGTVIGSIFWGYASDRIGRRATLLWTVGLFTGASLCGLAVDYWNSLVACFLMGVGVGGEVPLVFALASEYVPVKHRGRALLLLGILGTVGGYALASGIAVVVKSFLPETVAWRFLWLAGVVPAFMILVLRSRVVPESSRFLLARGRVAEARRAAEFLVGPIDRVPVPTRPTVHVRATPTSGRLMGRTLGLAFYSFAWGLAWFGLTTWLPTLFRQFGYGNVATSAVLLASALVTVPALLITVPLFTRWSTRGTLVAYALGAGAALAVLGIGVASGVLEGPARTAFLVFAVATAFLFIISIGGAFSLYASEVYPTNVRTGRSGIVAGAGKLGGVVGLYTIAILLRDYASYGLTLGGALLLIFGTLGVGLSLAAAVLFKAGVETRGRSLEEISADA